MKIDLIKGNCLDKMKYIESESVNLICVDLPYGSTGCAAVKTNRNFIGIELDDSYFDVATNRINTYITENNLENIKLNIN